MRHSRPFPSKKNLLYVSGFNEGLDDFNHGKIYKSNNLRKDSAHMVLMAKLNADSIQ